MLTRAAPCSCGRLRGAPCAAHGQGEGEYEGLSRRKDILVVGPGELGRRVLQAWAARFPEARVVAQTRTADNHEALSALGIEGLEVCAPSGLRGRLFTGAPLVQRAAR